MNRVTKFAMAASVGLAMTGLFATSALAEKGTVVTHTATNPIPGLSGYDFDFWNGNGIVQDFAPTYFKEVLKPDGAHTEVLRGKVANGTGHKVVYTANSGAPVPAGQTCWDFNGPTGSTDWKMVIESSGRYTLTCHFPATKHGDRDDD